MTALIVLSPLLAIVYMVALTYSYDILAHLWESVLTDYIVNSLMLVVGVGVCTFLLGVPTAWFTSTCEFPGCRLFSWALLLPLAFPAYIIAYTYTGVLDYAGPVYSFLRDVLGKNLGDHLYFSIRSVPGAVVMMSLVLYPYVYLLTRASFLEQSVKYLEACRVLGYSFREGFFRLAVPLARPAIATGISLALMETLADYGTVQFFAISTFTTGIVRAFHAFGDVTAAAQLSTMLLAFVLLLLFAERYSRRRSRFYSTSGKTIRETKIQLKGKQAVMAWVICFVPVLFGFIVPALILLKWVVFDSQWEVTAYSKLVWNSFYLALLAAIIIVLLSIFLCYARRAQNTRWVKGFVGVSGLGYAIPGVIVAVGVIVPMAWFDHKLILLAKTIFGIEIGLIFSGTVFALLFAYTVRFMAISLGALQTGLAKITPNMDNAARTLGYRTSEILRKIHIPLMQSSILTALLIVFVDVLKELPATLILRPFNFNTLAVRAFELASDERLIDAALPSLTIIATGIIPVILLSRTISTTANNGTS